MEMIDSKLMKVNNKSRRSSELHSRAFKHMPLGVADNYRYWGNDDTVFVENMNGAFINDCDGNSYVDFRLAYGPIILGYRDKRVDNAVIDCVRNIGTMTGFSSPLDSEVAEKIKQLCPNVEKVRFANSGTEAVMAAVRCARGYTGRQTIVVIEGAFHGLFDEMMWKVDVEAWNPNEDIDPPIKPFGSGLAAASRLHIEMIPLNDIGVVEALFAAKGKEIAGVVIEPIMGNCGSITASSMFLNVLRGLCDRYSALLIADEVKTGFRVAKGGSQQLLGFEADLTTYAKAIANGYPLAAFGGKAEVMDIIGRPGTGVVHGGTYTANLIGLSAANATLKILQETDALSTIEETGNAIKSVLEDIFRKHNVICSFAGHSSMFGVHFSESVPTNYRDWKKTNSSLYVRFARNLIENGVMVEPDSREPWFICEAHRAIDLQWLSDVASKSIKNALMN